MRQRTWLRRTVCMALVLLICVPTVVYVSHTHKPAPLRDSAFASPFSYGSYAPKQGTDAEACLICRLAHQLQAWLILLLPLLFMVRRSQFLTRLALRLHPLATRAGHPTLVTLKIRMNR